MARRYEFSGDLSCQNPKLIPQHQLWASLGTDLEQWEILRDASVDKDKLEDTHAAWQKDAERVVKELRQQGFHVVKIDVEIADLLLWCESQGIPYAQTGFFL